MENMRKTIKDKLSIYIVLSFSGSFEATNFANLFKTKKKEEINAQLLIY